MKHLIFSILLFGSAPLLCAEDVIETVHEAPNDIPEQKNIIPDGDERGKSAVAPTDRMTPKNDPYSAAQAEVIKALSLYNDGKMEAASDKALEAYEDLRALPRKVKRAKRVELKKLVEQAATVYVDASIAYVTGWLKRVGKNDSTLAEAKERLEDIRSVADNHFKLNQQLNQAILSL